MPDQPTDLTDVAYEIDSGLATITINRPDRFNSFRARTVDELIKCFKHAWASGELRSSARRRASTPSTTRARTRGTAW